MTEFVLLCLVTILAGIVGLMLWYVMGLERRLKDIEDEFWSET